jgi:RNA polymerase sigma factor (sigma-70 family)
MLIRKKHYNLIKALAWSFHQTSGIDWGELISEASLAYCEAVRNYNPSKGKFTTYAWKCVENQLVQFLRDEKRNRFLHIEDGEFDVPFEESYYFELEMVMSPAQKEIANIVFQNRHSFLSIPRRSARRKIAKKLNRNHEWIWNGKIREEMRGFRKLINELT